MEDIHPDGSILISQSGTGFQTEYAYQVLSATDARDYIMLLQSENVLESIKTRPKKLF